MDTTETAFMLILNAGNARSDASQAIQLASEYRFEEAEKYLQQAKEDLNEAHQTQTDLIQAEARGDHPEFGLIMVHAQDHLTMGMLTIDFAKSIIELNRKIYTLEQN